MLSSQRICVKSSTYQAIALRSPVSRVGQLPTALIQKRLITSRSSAVAEGSAAVVPAPAITLTDRALLHLAKLQSEQAAAAGPGSTAALLLRVGVRQGGCSGMSYHMDFTQDAEVKPEDTIMEHGNNLKLVVDPKSLLYLFGMRLDFSDALIGGGFQFNNPNATESCGCGKSFGV